MALHRLSAAHARQLLTRAADRTHRPLVDVAATVLRTGGLPGHATLQAATDELCHIPLMYG